MTYIFGHSVVAIRGGHLPAAQTVRALSTFLRHTVVAIGGESFSAAQTVRVMSVFLGTPLLLYASR